MPRCGPLLLQDLFNFRALVLPGLAAGAIPLAHLPLPSLLVASRGVQTVENLLVRRQRNRLSVDDRGNLGKEHFAHRAESGVLFQLGDGASLPRRRHLYLDPLLVCAHCRFPIEQSRRGVLVSLVLGAQTLAQFAADGVLLGR